MKSKSFLIVGMILTFLGSFFIFATAGYFCASSGMSQLQEVKMPPTALITLVSLVLLTIGLPMLSFNSGKNKGHKWGFKEGREEGIQIDRRRLIGALTDCRLIEKVMKPLRPGEYCVLFRRDYLDAVSDGLILELSTKNFFQFDGQLGCYDNLDLRRQISAVLMLGSEPGTMFVVNSGLEVMIEVKNVIVENGKAFTRV